MVLASFRARHPAATAAMTHAADLAAGSALTELAQREAAADLRAVARAIEQACAAPPTAEIMDRVDDMLSHHVIPSSLASSEADGFVHVLQAYLEPPAGWESWPTAPVLRVLWRSVAAMVAIRRFDPGPTLSAALLQAVIIVQTFAAFDVIAARMRASGVPIDAEAPLTVQQRDVAEWRMRAVLRDALGADGRMLDALWVCGPVRAPAAIKAAAVFERELLQGAPCASFVPPTIRKMIKYLEMNGAPIHPDLGCVHRDRGTVAQGVVTERALLEHKGVRVAMSARAVARHAVVRAVHRHLYGDALPRLADVEAQVLVAFAVDGTRTTSEEYVALLSGRVAVLV